ncbi:phosphoenolpyruvate synthase/pyruvate phosphate dikinase [Helicobacter cinaedi]|uniref:Phosphoenolpyruvate synthase/pyruvate phosphate dikinase n=1 Tax=Helicobacter cinaedi TaxID=213 RepID=A0A377JU47_9HELI|nr:PEP/pyruvate-binding domain-containing protein [Helicobacter cinaedi]STP11468.1 phosphoenolpyruvate synthase/pyruvate phosphate dikinase [Helicobacter cinaedi]
MNILHFSDKDALKLSLSGGKGASLAKVFQAGFAVPQGFIITTRAYEAFLSNANEIPSFPSDDLALLESKAKQYREHLLTLPLPPSCLKELESALTHFSPHQAFSVRSSSTLEDLNAGAFAGAHDTFLNCVGLETIAQKIKECFVSLWHTRAIAYRCELGFSHKDALMAVVVQTMVPSQKAGVSFSINPITCNLNEVLINANYGLGESVVGGEFDVDEYRFNTLEQKIESSHIAHKTKGIFPTHCTQDCIAPQDKASPQSPQDLKDSQDSTQGTRECHIDSAFADIAVLSEKEITQVASLNLALQRFYGFPQDIEWAIVDNNLYLLQSRPITTIPPRWSRDESAERYPKALSPFTWDYVDRAFHISLDYSFKLLGLPPMQGKWFAMFDNYIYGNQNAVSLYMGQNTLPFTDLDSLIQALPSLTNKLESIKALPKLWHRDLATYLQELGALKAQDLSNASLQEVWEFIGQIVRVGTEYFKPNIAISITQAMLYKILFALLKLIDSTNAQSLFALLTTTDNTKTSLVNDELFKLACMIKNNQSLYNLLHSTDSKSIIEQNLLRDFGAFSQSLETFLHNHGHREVEFDAYIPTWGEAPDVVLDTLKLLSTSPLPKANDIVAKKYQAKKQILSLVGSQSVELELFLYEFLELVETYTILDDEEHYQTTRLTPIVRKGVYALGERLKALGIVSENFDVFFANIASLESFVKGEISQEQLKSHITQNKQTYLENAAKTPKWELDSTQDCLDSTADNRSHIESSDTLQGVPASAGIVEGEVFIVRGSEDFGKFIPQSILIAQSTNPAWTPLFYNAKAVVTQSGGALSHGAVTAREMKIPAVMAVPNVMQILKNGDRIRVNGNNGKVEILLR